MENTKVCCKCNRELSVSEFYKDKTRKDGLQCWCKECCSKYKQTYNKTNRQYLNQYHNQYRQTHKQYYNQYQNQYQKEYKKQFKGYYLYIILDKQGNVVYVGQTTNYYNRLCQHLSGGVDSTKELFANNEWACIKYLDVGHIVANNLELKALENELIELYQPRCNIQLNVIRDIDRGRLFSLLAQLHSILNEWIIFKTNV